MTSDSPAPDQPRHRDRAGRRGRATRPTHPERPCLNCGDPTPGQYCPSCGQRKVDIQVSIRALLMDLLEDQFTLDKRLPRTLRALLLRPGHLTVEFVNGRIVRYIHPFRLYLVTSLVFFVLLSFFSVRMVRTAVDSGSRAGATVEEPAPSVLDTLADETERLGDTAAAAAPAVDTSDTDAPVTGDVDRPLREVFGWDEDPPDVNMSNAALDSLVSSQLRRLGTMSPRQAAETIAGTFFSHVPTMMFLLLPIFAAALKVLYIRRGRYYAEHFVFLLHVHSVVFILASVMLVLRRHIPVLVEMVLAGAICVYIYLAMMRVYGQGWIKTMVKFWILSWTYFWLLGISIPLAILATLLLF